MTDEVIIKEVEGQKIWLGEITTDKYTLKLFVGLNIFCVGGLILCGLLIITLLQFVVGIAAMGVIILILSLKDIHPAYVIHTPGVNGIVIFKTTPEADQVAICRATQELEVKVKEISKKRREMETIAGMCR